MRVEGASGRRWSRGVVRRALLAAAIAMAGAGEAKAQQAPIVTGADAFAGDTVARDQCLTIPVGPSAASECGDLRIVHALPSIRRLNVTNTPVLTYSSAQADPTVIVGADVTLPSGNAGLQRVVATLLVEGIPRAQGVWKGATWPANTARIAVSFSARNEHTGSYRYALDVTAYYDSTSATAEATGRLAVVNRHDSYFGGGWWLAGLEQLLMGPSGTPTSWIGGDGSFRDLTQVDDSTWAAPTVDHPDTVRHRDSTWVRLAPGGMQIIFDAVGHHIITRDRLGNDTQFRYDLLGRLSTIVVAGIDAENQRSYIMNYGTLGNLLSITAPGPGYLRFVTLETTYSNQVDSIIDPDNSVVAFRYLTPTVARIASRIDRRGAPTTFRYGAGEKLVGSRLDPSSTDSIVVALRPAEAQGLADSLGGGAVDTSQVYTLLDGPRAGSHDTVAFRVDRFGAMREVGDSVGTEVTLTRGDPRLPALVTRSVSGAGFETDTYYSARGNPDTVLALNPLGDGGQSLTQYQWLAPWDVPTEVVQPLGETTHFSYDGHGNLASEQVGADPNRMVTFTYDTTGNVLTVTTPQSATPTRFFYDSRGNLDSTRTPLGLVTATITDFLGRDSVTITPIDSVPVTHWRYRSYTYDERDRVLTTTDSAVAFIGTSAMQFAQVLMQYDAEGNATSITRRATPDSAGVDDIVTAAEYDNANRKSREHAPLEPNDPTRGTWQYDEAGNVTLYTDGTGKTITGTYDALGRLTQRVIQGDVTAYTPQTVSDAQRFAYDRDGRLASAINNYAQVGRVYAPGGALLTDTLIIQNADLSTTSQHDYVTSYHYDADGRRTAMDLPPALGLITTVNYGYDAVTGALATVTAAPLGTFRYVYTAAGLVDSLVMGDGTREHFTYDADGRTIRRFEKSVNDSTFHADSLSLNGAGQLLKVVTSTFDSTRTLPFVYAGLGSVLNAAGPRSENYTRDPFGDVLTKIVDGGTWQGSYSEQYDKHTTRFTLSTGTPAAQTLDTVLVTYDAAAREANRNEDLRMPGQCGQLQCDTVLAYTKLLNLYTATGQLLASQLRTSNDNLAQIDTTKVAPYAAMGRGVYEEIRHDALGRRVWRRGHREDYCQNTDPSSEPICFSDIERFVFDGDAMLYEIRQSGDAAVGQLENDGPAPSGTAGADQFGVVAYLNGAAIDQPLGLVRERASGATPLILHRDWQGAVDFATTTTGQPIDCGRPLAVTDCEAIAWPGLDMSVGFQRPVTDVGYQKRWGTLVTGNMNATGLIDMRARQFDPVVGQFLQEDPLGIGGGLNTYGFGGGDAVNRRDPSGMEACPEGMTWTIKATDEGYDFDCVRVLQGMVSTAPWDPASEHWHFTWGSDFTVPQSVVDFSAGLGDALLFGTGPTLRRALNIDGVDRCSTAYSAGGWTSFAVGTSRVAYAGLAKGISLAAASGVEASAARQTLKQVFRLGLAKGYRAPNLARYATDEALRAAAGRTNLGMNAYGAGVAAAGAVGASGCR